MTSNWKSRRLQLPDIRACDLHGPQTHATIKPMQFYARAISYFRQDLAKIVLSLMLIAVSVLLSVAAPLPMMILIDVVLDSKPVSYWSYRLFEQLGPEGKVPQIVLLAVLLLAIRMGAELLRMFQTLLNIRIGYNGLMRVRCELFRKLQALSLAYHKSQPQGDAIYRLSSDSLGFQGVLNVLLGVLVNAVTLVAMTVFMLSINITLTLIALAIVPLLVLTIHYYGKVLKRRYTQSYEVDSQITTAIQRSVASIGLVQAFGRERDEFENFAATQGNNVKVKMRLHWDEVMYWLVLGTIFAIGSAAILGYGGYLSYSDPGTFGKGMLAGFLVWLGQLYDPLNKLSSSGASLAGGAAQVQRVFEVLDRDPIIKDSPDASPLPRKPRVLSFEGVSFSYREGTPVLQDIHVTIAPGQMVAFVGSSGVGKTTLLNLLPRFYDPTSGSMKLDEHDASKVKVSDLRRHIALVLQESVILPTTVSENIAYGLPEATDGQIRRAAELAGAASFIEKLPQKYETEISESGANLSGGQKQRISIARALLTEAPIIVMDEPTSALDPQHEQMITETLRSLKRQRTIILVSHRLSTVADCDRIFVMNEGRIVEQGTHDELVAMRGLYYTMARHQMKLTEEVVTTDEHR
jgi:subfamily B ATP-binding cassette protein MsbA